MDCERLEATAIDLVYDELDDRARAEAEQHLTGCPRCAALIERLRAGKRAADQIELDVPSADLESRIFAAEAQARKSSPWPRRVIRAISTAGAYAMRPQVAMAAVVVVMVGISVVMLRGGVPSAHRASESDEGAPLAVDKQSPAQEPAPADMVAEKNDDGKESQADKKLAAPESPAGAAASSIDESELAKTAPGKKAELEKGNGEDDLDDPSFHAAKGAGDSANAQAIGGIAQSGAKGPVVATTDYDAAMTAYSAGKYGDAQRGFDASYTAGVKPSSALLYGARSRRAQGNCADALPRFKRVLSDYPSSAEAPNAALEGGECARDLGDVAQAKALFTQAAQYPSTKTRAEANLAALNTAPIAPAATATVMPAPAAKPPAPKAKVDSDMILKTDE